MEIVSDFALFIETLFQLLGFQNGSWVYNNVRGISFLVNAFPVFGSVFYIASNGYKKRVGMVFSPVLLMNSDQLYLPTFS